MIPQTKIDILIQTIAEGNSIEDSLKKSGITRDEFHETVRSPWFNQVLAQKRAEVLEGFRSQLQRGSVEAVQALRKILTAGAYHQRVQAARALLDARHKAAELDLETRKLEQNQEILPTAPEEKREDAPQVVIDNSLPKDVALDLWRKNRAGRAVQ